MRYSCSIMDWMFQLDKFLIQEEPYHQRLLLMRKLAAIQAQLNNIGREIKKVNEKVYATQVGCELCKGPHFSTDLPIKGRRENLEEAYYNRLVHLFQGGCYRATALGFIPEERLQTLLYPRTKKSMEKDPESFTLPCYINNVCFDNALADLGASISVMPLSTYLNLGLGELAHTKLIVELADRTMKYPKGIAENMLVGIGKKKFPVDFIILDMPEDVKVPLNLERPFESIAHAKIDVFKRKITLRVGEEKIIFQSVKPASSLIKRVYMLSLRERMELDLEARLMGELWRDQVDDLMATIEEGVVIEEFRARNDARMDLAAKKSTMLVKCLQSRNLKVLES
ncbi:hypothetical protein Tco_1578521 [Tanacetum coccineum]